MNSKRAVSLVVWVGVSGAGAIALGTIALGRGEPVNAIWLLVAAVCTYALGYRFYSGFIAAKVLTLDVARATPAERLDDGSDFVPTNKWVVFGHHFAAIAGPGPLVGPVLAAQFGYLPGTLWILVGSVFGGCVQDFVILLFSVRRDGKSLGQMAREEVGPIGGFVAFVAVITIIVILLGVAALIVVNALKASPWAFFTIAMTMPIALLMGVYMRQLRPGKVLEGSLLGFGLVLLAIWGGQCISHSPAWSEAFTFSAPALAVMIMLYGFAASAFPVWLLLAPRDYLSTFVKLGVIALLAAGILVTRPTLQMPALTHFIDGSGPVFAGSIFPFVFITIACGAISGFHSLISSGTTPKLIALETQTRMVGYGAMIAESFVGIMAMIAACVVQPGIYFAINSPEAIVGSTSASAAATIVSWGFPLTSADIDLMARSVGEHSLLNRTGGAPAFAVGMAHIFSRVLGGSAVMGLWYHFAIMFEALFILTILDAGTRVGRFMLQDAFGNIWKPFGRTSWYPSVLFNSALMVMAWGYFLWQGVKDPFGGINSLWPLFGISNQLLAIVALCVATTIIVKMGKFWHSIITGAPLICLVIFTFTAAAYKVLHPNPRIGFLSHANYLMRHSLSSSQRPDDLSRLVFNDRLDALLTVVLVFLIILIITEAVRECLAVIRRKKVPVVNEAPFVRSRLAEPS